MNKEELLEQYISGEISARDLRAFEALLKSDESFAKEVAIEIRIRKAAVRSGIADLEERSRKREELNAKGKRKWWVMLILCAVAGIVLLFVKLSEKNTIIENEPVQEKTQIPLDEKILDTEDATDGIDQTENESDPSEINDSNDNTPRANNDNNKSSPKKNIAEEVLNKKESAIMLADFFEEEQKALRSAGTDEAWKKAILENDMPKARNLLESKMKEEPESVFKFHYFYAGVLQLYTEGGDINKAIDYLVKSGEKRPISSLHLINAYTKKGQYERAKEILKSKPELNKDLPLSVSKRLGLK